MKIAEFCWRMEALFPPKNGTPLDFNLPAGQDSALGPYYIDWHEQTWASAAFDDEGVVLSTGPQARHPVNIAHFGLHSYNLFKKRGSDIARQRFLAQAHWLRSNQMKQGRIGGCYLYNFPYPKMGALAGWISAMAQGEAISLLLRAHSECPGLGFEEAAIAAAEPFRFDLQEGGVVWRGSQGDVFLEEYAVSPPSHVLNGGLCALFGVWDLECCTGLPWVSLLLKDATRTMLDRLSLYDSGYWSYSDLLATRTGYRRVAIPYYHAVHIAQLKILTAMTGEPLFAAVSDKWQSYVRSSSCRLRVTANTILGLLLRVFTDTRSVPGGERSVI